jgi:hypothetical protein
MPVAATAPRGSKSTTICVLRVCTRTIRSLTVRPPRGGGGPFVVAAEGIAERYACLKTLKGRERLESFVPPPYRRGRDHNFLRPSFTCFRSVLAVAPHWSLKRYRGRASSYSRNINEIDLAERVIFHGIKPIITTNGVIFVRANSYRS